jgi:uncharacterized protein (DUF433 family)
MDDIAVQHREITPDVCGGPPRVSGHRIAVEDIAIWHERLGRSVDEIATENGLTLAEIHAALSYYHDHRSSCSVASLGRVTGLLLTARGQDGVWLGWEPAAPAAQYHVLAVERPDQLLDPRRYPDGGGEHRCPALAPTVTECVDDEALIDSRPVLDYQVLTVCGPRGADEGPF